MREQSVSKGVHGPLWMKPGTANSRAFDLLSGTKSVASVLEAMGFEAVTVDKDLAWHPEICRCFAVGIFVPSSMAISSDVCPTSLYRVQPSFNHTTT